MTSFKLVTPLIYWTLIAIWTFIFIFYLNRLRNNLLKGRLLYTLLIILSIDAFRTLFESVYFGVWFTSLAGFLPIEVHSFLVRPELVFIPKILNVMAAIAIIFILLFKWLPQETQEKKRMEQLVEGRTNELKKEIENRKQIETDIIEHNEKLRIIFNSTPNILILMNEDGSVENINSKGIEFSGKVKDSLLGSLSGDVFNCLYSFEGEGCGHNPDCSKCPIQTRVVDTFKTGEPHTEKEGQMTFRLNGVETTLDLLISTALLDINGINNVLLSLTDITERKQTEKAFRISEEKLQSIFRAAPTGIGLVCNRTIQHVNDRICEMTGYDRNELIGKNASVLYLNNDDYEYVGTEKYRQIKQCGTGAVETRFKCKNGDIINILLSSTPLNLEDLSLGVTFTALDITERKQNEDNIKKSRERYRTIMNAMEYPIYIGSHEFVIEYLNASMIKRIGYDATGEKCFKAIHGFDKQCSWCNYGTIKDNKSQQFNIVSPRDDKSFDISLTPLANDAGSVSTLAVFRDVTAIKKITAQLQQAQKMEAIGTLAGGIAHDFNNILSPIVGYTQMLMEDVPGDSPIRNSLDEIFTGSMRAKDLVQQILTFSRQGNGELQPMKMQLIIKEALKLIRSSIPRIIEIKQNIQKDCGPIKADPTQIHQILMNLVTNAYHSIKESGGKIEVKVQEVTLEGNEWVDDNLQPGEYALLSVSDTGCGIPKSHMNKIFEPYFTTKGKDKGTGLGLSIIYGIVKEYKGDIQVCSEVDKGTTFNVYLPLMKKLPSPVPGETQRTIPTGTERILLVDDEIPIIGLQKQILERLGYKVTERSSSPDALRTFEANPDGFDLVITDMSMPQMTGDTLAKELTSIKRDIPIIICTGFSESIDKSISARIGIKGFLMKPIILSEMATMVRRVLDGI